MIIDIKPLENRVVIKRVSPEVKTKGGIIIPDAAQEKPAEGIIIAVGEGAKQKDGSRVALDVKVGDRVLFSKFGGDEIKLGGEDVLITRESEIKAIIKIAKTDSDVTEIKQA